MSSYESGAIRVTNQIQSGLVPVTPLAGNGIVNIPNNVTSTILTYTAPADMLITQISVSGDIYAKFQMYINTVLIDTRRGGPDRTVIFSYDNPIHLNNGQIMDIKVTHYVANVTSDFEATIYGGLF